MTCMLTVDLYYGKIYASGIPCKACADQIQYVTTLSDDSVSYTIRRSLWPLTFIAEKKTKKKLTGYNFCTIWSRLIKLGVCGYL